MARRSQNSKTFIFIGLGILVVILAALTVFLSSSGQQAQKNLNLGNTPSNGSPNPLIDEQDAQKVQDDYNKKLQDAGYDTSDKKYKFNFQLDPQLKSKKQSMLDRTDVYAATTCNIDTAPTTLPAYLLKTHWTADEAKKVAGEFSLSVAPSSLDGNYFFADEKGKSFFSLSEPSGFFDYHIALSTPSSSLVSKLDAQKIAEDTLKKHNLSTGLVAKPATEADGLFIFNWKKYLTPLKLIDPIAIKTYVGPSICSIAETESANTVEVRVRADGKLEKIIKNTRDVLSVKSVARESLEKALDEYHSKPIATIVSPETKSTPEIGDVTTDEAYLAYYEMGPSFAQTSYMPVYILGGALKGNPGTKAYIVIPAVGKDVLEAVGLITKTGGGVTVIDSSQKLDTFEAPTPTLPPPPKGTGSCYGNLVDYSISCTVKGTSLCSGYLSLPSSDDPLKICSHGCKNVSEVIDYSSGSSKSACEQLLDDKKIKHDKAIYKGMFKQNKSAPSGKATCSLNACPC